jgi:hypothetical protein
VKRCVTALLVGLVLSVGAIALALAPRGESAGQQLSPPAASSGTVITSTLPPSSQAAPPTTADPSDVADRSEQRRWVARRGVSTWLDAPEADPAWCANGRRAVVVDRRWQRAWLCDGGATLAVFPVTSARDQPDPGSYRVYEKDWDTFSDYGPRRSTLDRFVAFAVGEDEGARVGFHAIPRYEDDGRLAQPRRSVGSSRRFGDSSGCIRLLPEHAELVWGFLDIGDSVVVIS